MKKIFGLFIGAVILLSGCAGQSKQATSSALQPQQPWLCEGVNGEWQCNRGDSTQQQSIAASRAPQTQSKLNPPSINEKPASTDTPKVASTDAIARNPSEEAQAPTAIKTTDAATPANVWTIQWAALSSPAAAKLFGRKHLSDAGSDYEIRPIRVNSRDYYILFSGRFASRAAAVAAAQKIQTTSPEKPFFRTIASIDAATGK
jgi:septal ring-binding cell division protein DamX